MDILMQDIRFGLRVLRRSPGFSVAAILTLALGIGANVAIYSVVHSVLARPLPIPEPDRVAMITRSGDVSIPDGVDWRAQARGFSEIALFLRSWDFDLTGSGEPERIVGSVVEPSYFRLLRIAPEKGRAFTDAENRTGGARVAVISHGFWVRRFASDPHIIGRVITLSDHPTEIIGVMPSTFDVLQQGVELWVPAAVETPSFVAERGTNNFDALGRLSPGVGWPEARAELKHISEALAAQYPRTNANKIVDPIPLLEYMVGNVRVALIVLLSTVGLVLLLASVNLAGLLLARVGARQGELALRRAVGAGRGRLLRQLITEGLILAVLGGLLGAWLAVLGRNLLVAIAPATLPRVSEIRVDATALLFAGAITIASGLLFSLVPALQVVGGDPGAQLRGGGTGRVGGWGRQRLLGALVVGEVSLACLLLIGSGLLGRSVVTLLRQPLGFDPRDVLTVEMVLPESRYSKREAQTDAFRRIVAGVAATSGVASAASVIGIPLDPGNGIGAHFVLADHPFEPGHEPGARNRPVVGDYFQTMRVPILKGRSFTERDDEHAPPVAIVNEQMAHKFWAGRDPVGERIAWREPPGTPPRWMTIVGVAADVKSSTLDAGDDLALYTSYVQRTEDWQRFGTIVARGPAGPAALTASVRRAMHDVDPTLPLGAVSLMTERRERAIAQPRFNALALGAFALAALLLAVQGIYGVLSTVGEQRRTEIGLRLALGAERGEVLRMMVMRGLRLTAMGLVAGLVGAALLGRLIGSLLFGVQPVDAATYIWVAVAIAGAALFGSLVPAWRASRVQPAAVLRGG